MNSRNESAVERQPDEGDLRELIRRADRHARRIFQTRTENLLFPYSEHRFGSESTFTSASGDAQKQPRRTPRMNR